MVTQSDRDSASTVSGSSLIGALGMARETGSSMASSKPTTATTWLGAKRSINAWACAFGSPVDILFPQPDSARGGASFQSWR